MILYLIVSLLFVIFSYGFVDAGLKATIASFTISNRWILGGIFLIFLSVYFALYIWLLRNAKQITVGFVLKLLIATSLILACSYSMVSYDVFNYMTTAKVAFTHGENPYIIMPVEIPNEPNLAFTRAANKVALYGPVWILLSIIPHAVGMGNVWATMIAFKFFAVMWLWVMTYLIWRKTKSVQAVIFFACNPLVLIEVCVAGHNDIVMMTLMMFALVAARSRWIFFALAASVKGATLALFPLLFNKFSYRWAFWIMLGVFVVLAPIREELYPWYAIWFLPFAALLLHEKRKFEPAFAMALSVGLELRHIPYMIMGYYEGPGPILRLTLTVIPIVIYLLYYRLKLLKA